MRQWHRNRRGHIRQPQAVRADPPKVFGKIARSCAQPAKIVESDCRLGPGQIDTGVQITQQPVRQAVRQRTQLFLRRLDHRAKSSLPSRHLCPRELAHRQRGRVLGGEPSGRA
ncbi:Uncharacterised protein [Mycobacteroides abscessus subsp. massiliense]|nr:Uncharacterised protein [Mycobacteroides abscessus subsp. massiliense]